METFKVTLIINTSIILGTIILSQIAALLFRRKALKSGESILEPLTSISDILIEGLDKFSIDDKNKNEMLNSLFEITNNRKEHHKRVFLKLYQYHFATVSILLILSVISAIIVFIVVDIGLKNSDPCLRTLFFTFAALTTFYALSPIVYKQDITIDKNLKNYIFYDNLQNEIYNYAITNLTITGDSEEFNKFHARIIKRISEINSINLDFDFKSIKTPDFFNKKLQE